MAATTRKKRTAGARPAVKWRASRIPIELGFGTEYYDGWRAKVGDVELTIVKSPAGDGHVYGWTAFDNEDGRDASGQRTTAQAAKADAEKAAQRFAIRNFTRRVR